MKLALKELRRRPGRFIAATAVLTVLAVLLMFLGGLLDGLLAGSTGAYRAQRAELIVYSSTARESLIRSRVDAALRDAVDATDGVEATGGLGTVQLGARPGDDPESRDLISIALLGYELAPRGLPDEPPAEGEVIADSTLEAEGIEEGDTLLLGPARREVTVTGFVDDNNEQLQPVLNQFNQVLDILNDNEQNFSDAVDNLGPYANILGEAVASGPYFSSLVGLPTWGDYFGTFQRVLEQKYPEAFEYFTKYSGFPGWPDNWSQAPDRGSPDTPDRPTPSKLPPTAQRGG